MGLILNIIGAALIAGVAAYILIPEFRNGVLYYLFVHNFSGDPPCLQDPTNKN
jgi:hypothetical protein